MIGTVLLHGDMWTILLGVAYMLVLYIALPVGAVLLAFRYFRRKRANR